MILHSHHDTLTALSPVEAVYNTERPTKQKATMTTITHESLSESIKSLARQRPRFCSEVDFQFTLAFKIREKFPDVEIRCGCSASHGDKSTEIDIIVNSEGEIFPIALRYMLKDQKHDTEYNRDMQRDIDRVELLRFENFDFEGMNFKEPPRVIKGRFVIWLSDNDRFWNNNSVNSMVEHEGRTIPWEYYKDDFWFALVNVLHWNQ